MEASSRVAFRIAAALGLLGVVLGAFGAHGLAPTLAQLETVEIWKTAALYHLVHAVALLALAAAGRASWPLTACWTGGVAIFSGTLYVLAVTGLKWLGAITPIGGTLLIAGWALVMIRGK